MATPTFRPFRSAILASTTVLFLGTLLSAPSINAQATASPAPTSSTTTASQTQPNATPAAKPRRRTRRRYVRPSATAPATTTPQPQTVGATPEQRRRDALILAAQQKQSAETARQQAIVTGNVIKERQVQQAEPRIQDAPGPGSQPLAGEPAGAPAQQNDPAGIQDAPGPAQTLPQPVQPTAPATAPAPAQTPAPQI